MLLSSGFISRHLQRGREQNFRIYILRVLDGDNRNKWRRVVLVSTHRSSWFVVVCVGLQWHLVWFYYQWMKHPSCISMWISYHVGSLNNCHASIFPFIAWSWQEPETVTCICHILNTWISFCESSRWISFWNQVHLDSVCSNPRAMSVHTQVLHHRHKTRLWPQPTLSQWHPAFVMELFLNSSFLFCCKIKPVTWTSRRSAQHG